MADKIINYKVRFDTEQASLNNIRTQISTLSTEIDNRLQLIKPGEEKARLLEVQRSVEQVGQVFQQAFNTNLGTMNISKLSTGLKGLNLNKVASDFASLGARGVNAFGDITAKILTTNTTLQKTRGFISNIATTLTSSLKWSLAYGAINEVGDSIRKSYDYVKSLDGSLNDIRIVTEKSADEMERFARSANRAAKEIGVSTKAYTDASLIYYQQGLGDAEAQERARITSVASNITGQSTSEVSEQLTAIWNGYKVDAAEAELYIDKVAKVAAQTGADLEELATGMSKVASAANVMGVDVDQLNAQLATVITVTRQAPESVGTAFKTIYSRINAIETGSKDAETSLKQYTADMKEYGFSVLDANGKLRDTGEIIEEIGGKWEKLTKEQQVGLAQVMAGQRQYNNLLALFENWDMYTKSLNDSANAAGTLQKQQDIYMESTEAHMAQLQASSERLYSAIFDTESINDLTDILSSTVDLIANMTEAIGGGSGALGLLGATALRVFSRQLGTHLAATINNFSLLRQRAVEVQTSLTMSSALPGIDQGTQHYHKMAEAVKEVYDITTDLNEQQRQTLNSLIFNFNEAGKQQNNYTEEINETIDALKALKLADDSVKAVDDTNQDITGFEKVVTNNKTKTSLQNSYDVSSAALNDYKDDLFGVDQALRNFNSTQDKTESDVLEVVQAVNRAKAEYEACGTQIILTKEQQDRLSSAESAYNKALKQGSGEVKAAQQYYRVLKQVLGENADQTRELLNVMGNQLPQAFKQAKQQAEEASQGFEQFKKSLDIEKRSQSFMRGISGIVQIGSSIQTLMSLKDIFSNDDLTTGEAILQTMINVGYALPSLMYGVTAFKEFKNALTGLKPVLSQVWSAITTGTVAVEANAAATALDTEVTLANNIVEQTSGKIKGQAIKQRIVQILGIKETNEEKIKEALITNKLITAEQYETAEKTKNKWATIQRMIAGNADAKTKQKETIETDKNTAATIRNKLAKLGWKAVAIAAVAAVAIGIYALVKAYNAQETASQKAEKRLKNEKEALEEMKSSLKSTQEQVKSLEESFTKYKSAITTLALCTKGTEDWNKALKEVNVAANELIDKYPQLKAMGDLWKLDDDLGTWVLDQSKIKELQDQLITAEQTQSFNVLQQERDVADANKDAIAKREKEKIQKKSWHNTVTIGDNNTKAYITKSGQVAVGGQREASTFKISDALFDTLLQSTDRDSLNKAVQDAYKEQLRSSANDAAKNNWDNYKTTVISSSSIDSIWESVKAIQKAEEENLIVQKNIEKQWLVENKDLTDPYLTGYDDVEKQAAETILYRENEKFQSDLEDGLTKLFNKGIKAKFTDEEAQALTNAFGEDYLDKVNGDNGFTDKDKTGGQLLETLVGLTNGKYSIPVEDAEGKTGDERNLVKGKDGDRVFYLSVDGENKNVSQETIYGYIAAQKAIEQLGESANKASSYLSKLSDLEGSDALFKLIAEGKIDNAKVSDILAFQGQITDSDKDGKLTLDEYTAHFQSQDEDTQKALMASLGVDTIEEVAETIYKSIGQVAQYAGEGLSATTKKAFEQIFKGDALSADFTVKEQQRVGQLFQDIFNEFGEDGSNALKDIFEKASNDNELAEALLDFDFSTGSFDDFKQALIDAGQITEDISDDKFKMLYDSMYDLGDAAYATAEMMANAAKLVRGDAISAEEYAQYAPFASEYFTKMHDGTYLLTGDAEEFYKLIKASRQQDFKDRIQESKDNIDKMKAGANGSASNRDKVNALFAAGLIDAAQTQEWLLELDNNNGQFAEDSTYATDFETKIKQAGDFSKYIDAATIAIDDNQEALATTAETQGELNELVLQGWVSQENAAEGEEALRAKELKALGVSEEELKNYIKLRQKELGAAEALGLSEKEYVALLEEEYLKKQKIQKGFEKIEDSFPDLADTLKDEKSTDREKAQAAATIQSSLKEAGIEVSDNFLIDENGKVNTENLTLIEKVLEGDFKALQQLKLKAAEGILFNVKFDNGKSKEAQGQLEKWVQEIKKGTLTFDDIPLEDFRVVCQKLIEEAGITAEQIEALFEGLDINIDINYDLVGPLSTGITGDAMQVKGQLESWLKEKGFTNKDGSWIQNSEGEWLFNKLPDVKEVDVEDTSGFKPKDKDTKKEAKKLSDVYQKAIDDVTHDLTRKIDKISKKISSLEKKRKGLYGKELIKNLNEQLDLIEEQNEAYREKQDEIRKILKSQRDLSEAMNWGLEFDEETKEITNFAVVYEKMANALIQAELELTEAGEKATEEAIERAERLKQELQELLAFVDSYEGNLSEIDDIEAQIEDNEEKRIELQIEKFNMAIEIRLDMAEVKKQWHEFEEEVINRDTAKDPLLGPQWIAEDRIKQYEELYGPGGPIQELITHIQKVQAEAEKINAGGESSVYGNKLEYALEDLQKYYEELMQYMQDAEELADEVREQYVVLLNNAQDAFDDQINTYEVLQGILEHDIALLKLLNGEDSNYAKLSSYYDKQMDNYKSLLDFQRQSVAFWQEQLAFAEEGTEAYNVAKENLISAIEGLNDTLETSLEIAQEKYLNAVNAIFEEFENKLTNGKGLSFLEKEWDMLKDNADDYLDSVNRAYELSKLEANYRKAIDESISPSAQKQLNALMGQEMAMLREKDKLSQYDIDRANLKYQLTLKQIALEDAQRNKSQMRLKRDSSGNYSYQYVADKDQTSQIQQEIDSLNNQMYNLDKDAFIGNADDILSYYAQFKEEMIAAQEIKDPALRAQEQERIMYQFSEKMKTLMTENQNIRLNLMSYELEEMVTGWDSSIQDMIDKIIGEGGWNEAYQDTADAIEEANRELQEDIHELSVNAGVDLEELQGGFDAVYESVGNLIAQNDELIGAWSGAAEAMQGIIDKLALVEKTYEQVKDAGIACATQAKNTILNIMETALQAIASMEAAMASEDTDWARVMAQTYQADAENGGADFAAAQDERTKKWNQWEREKGEEYADQYANTEELNSFFSNVVKNVVEKGGTIEDSAVLQLVDQVANGEAYFTDDAMNAAAEQDKKKGYVFNTGGYTGEWTNGDKEGRLAFLHQKEIVLNKNDTANFLSAVDILRDLDTKVFENFASVMMGLTGLSFKGVMSKEKDSFEQSVYIDANFPNVSSSEEIKSAINQLLSQLEQKIYSNKK